jgi:hypothetical protein
MKEFSIPMALVDYIPVVFFLLGMLIIAKDLKHAMNKIAFALFVLGAGFVTVAGFLKATYKLLYALGAGDFTWMSSQFFSNQAFGFLLAGVGLAVGVMNLKKNRTYALIPTMGLVGIMVVGLGAMDAGLCFLANKLKKRSALVCFIVSFFLCLGMGYLSSKNFDKAYMNWIAQGVNLVGQLLLFAGAKILHNAGLDKI